MTDASVDRIAGAAREIHDNISRVIVGKADVVELALVAILCEGHILIEDVPGIGKTMLARSIARSLGCSFNRIQCTPDLLPSDVTGTYIYNQKTNDFEFRSGPVFAQVLLADEINRATPRTQSAFPGGYGGAADYGGGRDAAPAPPLPGAGNPEPRGA